MAEIEQDQDESNGNATIVGVVVNNNSESKEEHPDISALKALFKTTLETRNFEISMLVQRNNFFMIFQGVLLAGIIQSAHTKPIVSFMVCLAGFLVSSYQVKMAAGAKFWQEYWEAALQRIEQELLESIDSKISKRRKTVCLFHDQIHVYEKMVKERLIGHGFSLTNKLIMNRYSVSRVPIYVAMVLAAIWLTLIVCSLREYPPFSIPSFIVGF